MQLIDPVAFYRLGWPDSVLYDKQIEILYSVRDNYETVVPAGNGLGKDYIAGFIPLWWMCSRSPARVVTTSVQGSQLKDVLWGEIHNFFQSCQVALPLQFNHLNIRQIMDGEFVPKSQLVGQVCERKEGLLGRHLPSDIPRTLVIFDEASGVDTATYESTLTWAHRILMIGNCFPCENFFKAAVVEGDRKSVTEDNYRQKIIHINAMDSPNVKLGFTQVKKAEREPLKILIKTEDQPHGILTEDEYKKLRVKWVKKGKPNPTIKTLVPGLITYAQYIERRSTWDKMLQCISIDGQFYEGADIKMFPPEWLNAAEMVAIGLKGRNRKARTLGVDSAEGGDNTAWVIIDDFGVIDVISKKTRDTSVIAGDTLGLMKAYNILAENVLFDRGGGGLQHADQLRKKGYAVKSVGFGEAATPDRKRGLTTMAQRKEQDEIKYVYKNRRAEMYGLLRDKLNPINTKGFGIPKRFKAFREQLAPIPFQFDGEGRIYLPPKYKKSKDSTETTLTELIGHSPDEVDALVLAVYGLERKIIKSRAGAY